MSCAVHIERIIVDGWKAPHALKIELIGTIEQTVGDGIVTAMHNHGHELHDAIAPTVEEAVQRILVDGAADCQERQDIEDFEI